MLNIALFGPPGAGKGTQSRMLIEKYSLMYISTGDLLRIEINANTELGLMAKDIIACGGLASDEIIMELIENHIKTNPYSNGILFDGFPRTVVQAYILEGLMQKMHTSLMCVLSLDVPRETLIKRLFERAKVSGRCDDKKDVILNRLEEYKKKTLPVAHFFNEKGKYFLVNGIGNIDTIFNRLTSVIEQENSKNLLNIVLCGFPGSGKRSHSVLIEEKYGLVQISTGRLFREEIEKNTELGKIAAPFIESGDNVPDEIAIRLIERKIKESSNAKGFIFKGFPSTSIQAYILDGLLNKIGSSVTCAININSSSLQCMKRLSQRGKTNEARIYDKDPEIIIHRLEVYEKNSPKVIEYYDKQNILHNIKDVNDANASFIEVSKYIDFAAKRVR